MFKIGCAEKILEVPLFAELYGYGPFQGRRNQGVLAPLYARAFSFFDGEKRVLMIYSDTGAINTTYARELRAILAEKHGLDPAGIAFFATHTHSAPTVGTDGAAAFGTPDPEFQEIWKTTLLEVADKALASEEEVVKAEAGAAPLSVKVGTNRIDPEEDLTDPAIRYVRFLKKDGSCKVIIHNHGAHGIACNGGLSRLVSSDWMGAANAIIQEKALCEMPLFLQGAAGNINTAKAFSTTEDRDVARTIAKTYVEDLEKDFTNAVEVPLGKLSCTMKTVDLPSVVQDAASLRHDAGLFREKDPNPMGFWGQIAFRLEEMAILLETGRGIKPHREDLQVIQMGDLSFFFIPGEIFIQPGLEILENSKAKFPFVITYANGNAGYFFTREVSQRYPTIITSTAVRLFGYYEIYGYMQSLHYKYADNIAEFVVANLKEMEK